MCLCIRPPSVLLPMMTHFLKNNQKVFNDRGIYLQLAIGTCATTRKKQRRAEKNGSDADGVAYTLRRVHHQPLNQSCLHWLSSAGENEVQLGREGESLFRGVKHLFFSFILARRCRQSLLYQPLNQSLFYLEKFLCLVKTSVFFKAEVEFYCMEKDDEFNKIHSQSSSANSRNLSSRLLQPGSVVRVSPSLNQHEAASSGALRTKSLCLLHQPASSLLKSRFT